MPAIGVIRYSQIRTADRKGTGVLTQMFGGGATVNGNAAKYNASGDLIDGGAPPGGSGLLSWVTLTAPVDGDFSWVNQGGASIVSSSNPTRLFLNAPAGAGANLRVRVKTAPGTPYTATAIFHPAIGAGGNANCGILFRESSSGKLHLLAFTYDNTGDKVIVQSKKYSSPTAWSADYLNKSAGVLCGSAGVVFRIADNGSNRICSYSTDGENFVVYHSVTRLDFLTGGADQIGFYAEAQNASLAASILLVSWKQA